jgi:hypothetical protein
MMNLKYNTLKQHHQPLILKKRPDATITNSESFYLPGNSPDKNKLSLLKKH